MRVAIIEDEQLHKDLLTAFIKKWADNNKNISKETVIKDYENAEQFLFSYDDEAPFDILFIDIQMSGMNGMDMAKRVREKDKAVSLVFTTGITDYIQEGYDVEAMHYLIKPLKEEKVYECLEKASSRKKAEKYIIVHTEEDILKLNAEAVNYVEARGHRCVVAMDKKLFKDNNNMISIRESLSEMEKLLDEADFVKCHRSYICRICSIYRIEKTDLYFDDGSSIPVSRRMYDNVNKAFIKYFCT